ncbi:MAG: hypothetical protein OIN86_12750 [Candidatus Methanoperedens sp.]|nr:hypothetical protein [Candidatus Methanoperedens sp.]CAG0948152.1 hypothetical protein METP1_00004 [Methanosarcinales archaeon]
MSILDVTEDQIFQTLGKGRDPNFKPIEKTRPVIVKPKKTYSINQNVKAAPICKVAQPVEQVVKTEITVPSLQNDDSVKKLTEDLNQLNNRVTGLQKMVKWYIVPQFVVVVILIIAIVVTANP